MNTHPDEFLVIVIEDVVSPEETAQAFQRAGLLRYAYTPDRSAVWPTMGQLIERDKRLLVMAERDNGDGKFPLVPVRVRPDAGDAVHVQQRQRDQRADRAAGRTGASRTTRCSR